MCRNQARVQLAKGRAAEDGSGSAEVASSLSRNMFVANAITRTKPHVLLLGLLGLVLECMRGAVLTSAMLPTGAADDAVQLEPCSPHDGVKGLVCSGANWVREAAAWLVAVSGGQKGGEGPSLR